MMVESGRSNNSRGLAASENTTTKSRGRIDKAMALIDGGIRKIIK